MGNDPAREARDNLGVLATSIKNQVEEAFELGYEAGWAEGYESGMEDGKRHERSKWTSL